MATDHRGNHVHAGKRTRADELFEAGRRNTSSKSPLNEGRSIEYGDVPQPDEHGIIDDHYMMGRMIGKLERAVEGSSLIKQIDKPA